MSQKKRKLLWHTTDLRYLNHPLHFECDSADEILPIYCFNPRHFKTLTHDGVIFEKTGALRTRFLLENLQDLRQSYQKAGAKLILRIGTPESILPEIATHCNIDEVWTQQEVTPEELQQQSLVQQALKSIPLMLFSDNTLIKREHLPFKLKQLPNSFTSFRKKIEKTPKVFPSLSKENTGRLTFLKAPDIEIGELPTLKALGFDEYTKPHTNTAFPFVGGESHAHAHLKDYFWNTHGLAAYKQTRNGMIGAHYSSKFSPWLSWGAISAQHIYREVKQFEEQITANDSTYWLIFELLWRDFFKWVAEKNGASFFHKGGIQQRAMRYENQEGVFASWVYGNTSNTFVNACMNELRLTGYLSNRGRQNAASYLCHDLNVDWRWGAEWFEHCLIDYDPCSNWGNWMYIAGVGNGGQNRRFDVDRQASHYDSDHRFRDLWAKVGL